ncbi:alpha/beta fold hydrolase [Pseudorhodoferax sp. Leaf267]|uniref:alpha/beta fold hydrolase n=1 Tax=Pseudorhodoferax sp. Leaf267 TaxID=1736316 RepID=UPI0006FA2438|nr:alpha/beta fold hydrolase [Pseudorhodoferax sp. Leaf267]KQP17641.1 alpha/beta hydrolase [Pseudorhodoferax sp. Leaf267]
MPFARTLPNPIARLQAAAQPLQTPCGDGHIQWHRWGPADAGPRGPVVLLHGGSGSWTHWVRNIDALVAAGRQVLAPDLPGFGDSAVPPGGGDADAVAPALEQGLQLLLGAQACDLVGFSFGGLTAGLLLAEHPARATRLVLVGAPAMGVSDAGQIALRGWRHLPDAAAREAVHRHNLAVLMLHKPEAIDALALALHGANVERDRMQRRRLARTEALKNALQRVACPVHAIYGNEDVLYAGRMEALAKAFAESPHFQGLTLVDEAGHWVQYERPDAFDAALRQVLA